MTRARLAGFFAAAFAVACPLAAEEPDKRPAAAVQDNSFLIEEAYNQETGVVQHILNLQRADRDWFLSFTQEWPVHDQTHQFSYTVPYSWVRTDSGRRNDFGDVALNYRLQALEETDRLPAFAPRVSLLLPTGSEDKGTGAGVVGYQMRLPVSKIVADRWTVHGNAGLTSTPHQHGRNPTSYMVGGSAIYAVTDTFNLMLETLGEWTEQASEGGGMEREFRYTVAPGFRHAFNLSAGQLVWGAAAPIGFVRGEPDYGVFLYLSFEHSFLR